MWLSEQYTSTGTHPGCVVSRPAPLVKEILGSTPPTAWDIAAKQEPAAQGDFVTAMPYWSSIDKMSYGGAGDVPFQYQWRTPQNTTWDVPPRCDRSYLLATGVVDGKLNVYDYAAFPIKGRALPKGTAAQWLTCQRMADTKAMANLHKALVNVPLLIAERKETIDMIVSRVGQLSRLVQDVAKRDISRWKKAKNRLERRKVSRDAASAHLEMIFGILPLIGEVEGLCEFLARPKLDFVRSRGVFAMNVGLEKIDSVARVTSASPIQPINPASLLCTVNTKGVLQDMISVRTALRYKLESQLAANASLLGFSPLGAAFDLIPLSFITGWFSNLDDWIRALDPVIGATFETGSRNRRQRTLVYSGITLAPSVPTGYSGNEARWVIPPAISQPAYIAADKQLNTRVVLDQPPETSLHWDVDVGLYELTAGLSLAVQRYIKPLKRLSKHKAFRYRARKPKWLPKIRYTKSE